MTPLDIKYEIKKHKKTQKQIAREIGVSEMTVSKVVNHLMISDRVMRSVAEAIGRDHRAVFPEYYFGPKQRRTSKVAA
jgi:transcriptional regulator with XRE-family HTH domain